MAATIIGQHIVVDDKICHGQPTFRGTRILVGDVLDQVAEGRAWESIIEEWHGSISKEAITEALKLAGYALIDRLASRPRQRVGNR
jgi:uncharacterized protein (DUF433 family)